MLRHLAAVTTVLAIAACGGSAIPSGPDAGPEPAGSGTIAGQVVSEFSGGFEVVAGASVTIVGGASTVSDEYGNFVFDNVPTGDVQVEARGPRTGDPNHPFVYSTWRARLSVTADETTLAGATLLRGCERFLDAETGGTIDVANCGHSSSAQLVFPANSLVRNNDGAAFAGMVRVVVAVADPAVPAQLSAFPDTERPMDDLLMGGLEVRLTDAVTDAPLQVASGNSVDVAVAVHADAVGPAAELSLRWFDPDMGAWEDEPAGAIETIAGRPHYRFLASHFSTRLVDRVRSAGNRSCLRVTVDNWRGPVLLQFASAGRRWFRSAVPTPQTNTRGVIDCVDAPSNATFSMRVRGAPALNYTSVLTGWKTVTTGAPEPVCTSTNNCQSVGFRVGAAGCLDGRFQSGACSASTATQSGMVRFLRDGRVFATRSGNVCDLPFYTLMVPHGDSAVTIVDSHGSAVTVGGPSGSSCTNINGVAGSPAVVAARYIVDVVSSLVAGSANATDPGSAFTLNFDGDQSVGTIHTYAWDVFAVSDGSDTLVWSQSTTTPNARLRVDAGRYRTRLRVYSGTDLVAGQSKLTDVSSVPAPTASFTVSSTVPFAGESVHVDAAGSSNTGSIVSYEWDFDGDMVFDGSGVTATHVYNTEGPQQIRLRVTDNNGQIGEAVIDVTVQPNLPGNTLLLTIVGNGTVSTQSGGGFRCVGPATCTHTVPDHTEMLLEARNPDGTPNHTAWGNAPNGNGYQMALYFNGPAIALTASF